jgi:transposase-like protein
VPEAAIPRGQNVLDLDDRYFRDDEAARTRLESVRWPAGTICCQCGCVGTGRKVSVGPRHRSRHGLYRCAACGRQFTVTIGTVLESSHIPLHKWLQAVHLLFAANRPVSTKLIERTLGITYKSAWIMVQRLRRAERLGRVAAIGRNGLSEIVRDRSRTFLAPPAGETATRQGMGSRRPARSTEQHQKFKDAAAALDCKTSQAQLNEDLSRILGSFAAAHPPIADLRQSRGGRLRK